MEKKKVHFPNSAGWTPKKQFCFRKSVPFRILSPHSKLWYLICIQVVKQWWTWRCGFSVICLMSQRSDCSPLLFLFWFSPPNALFFVTDHTTKLGMKDLLKAQQWWVEIVLNLLPPQYRKNALTTTSRSPVTQIPVQFHALFVQNYKTLFGMSMQKRQFVLSFKIRILTLIGHWLNSGRILGWLQNLDVYLCNDKTMY